MYNLLVFVIALVLMLLPLLFPQAKGRIERTFRTHQDRLVAGLKCASIKTPEEAINYLESYAERHNARFAKPVDTDVFYRLENDVDLDKVISFEYVRKVSSGNTISYKSKQYMPIVEGSKVILPEATGVKLVETVDGNLHIKHNGEYFDTEKVADYCSAAHTPSTNHPWRRSFK